MTSKFRMFAVAALLAVASPAWAGKGGSVGQIRSAVASGSVDAIVAELERSEALLCVDCISVVDSLLSHARYEVREAAGWWIAKRPLLRQQTIERMAASLGTGTGDSVRNAADFLGAARAFDRLPELAAAYDRGVSAEARLAIVRAAGVLAKPGSNAVLTKGLTDAEPSVRLQAVTAWRDVSGQTGAVAVAALLSDADDSVRAEAAATIGGLREQSARVQLETLVVADSSATVRRNAAWALGQLGRSESAGALDTASSDPSPLVRGVARAARRALR